MVCTVSFLCNFCIHLSSADSTGCKHCLGHTSPHVLLHCEYTVVYMWDLVSLGILKLVSSYKRKSIQAGQAVCKSVIKLGFYKATGGGHPMQLNTAEIAHSYSSSWTRSEVVGIFCRWRVFRKIPNRK